MSDLMRQNYLNVPSSVDDEVQSEGSEYQAMRPRWHLPMTLMGGTPSMRAAGTAYLPRNAGELEPAYNTRLSRSFLFNAFRHGIQTLRTTVFAKPVMLREEAKRHETLAENVDTDGRDLHTFANALFDDAAVTGKTHILVDYTTVEGAETRADERDAGARPYFVHIPSDCLFAWYDQDNQLEQIRFLEIFYRRSGRFGEEKVERIRVIERESFEVYERVDNRNFELVQTGPHTLGEIPLVTIYFNRTGFMTAEPPMEDLAYKNLEHYQSSSDQRNILHVARVPLWFATGMESNAFDPITFGAHTLIHTSKGPQDASLEPLEFQGNAIAAGRLDQQDIEEHMALLALEPLVRRQSGDATATQRTIDEAKKYTQLEAWAIALGRGLDEAFAFADKWEGETPLEAVTQMDTDFGIGEDAKEKGELLLKARMAGEISRAYFWNRWRQLGIIDDQFDAADEADELDREAEENMDRLARAGLDESGAPGEPAPADDDGTTDVPEAA